MPQHHTNIVRQIFFFLLLLENKIPCRSARCCISFGSLLLHKEKTAGMILLLSSCPSLPQPKFQNIIFSCLTPTDISKFQLDSLVLLALYNNQNFLCSMFSQFQRHRKHSYNIFLLSYNIYLPSIHGLFIYLLKFIIYHGSFSSSFLTIKSDF